MAKKRDLSHVVGLIGDLVTWLGQRGHQFTDEQIGRVQGALTSLGASDDEAAAAVGDTSAATTGEVVEPAAEEPQG